jgi:hypothetical protein
MTRDLIREEIKAEDLLERTNTRREFTERLLDGSTQPSFYLFVFTVTGIFTGRKIRGGSLFPIG